MRLSREVALRPSHFDIESFLSLLLCYRTDAQADTDAEVSLVNEQPTVREDGDAGCACLGHELLQCGAEEHFRKGLATGQRAELTKA